MKTISGWRPLSIFLTMTLSGAIGNAVAGELIERFGYTVVGICIIPLVALLIIAAILFLPNLQGGAPETPAGIFGSNAGRLYKDASASGDVAATRYPFFYRPTFGAQSVYFYRF